MNKKNSVPRAAHRRVLAAVLLICMAALTILSGCGKEDDGGYVCNYDNGTVRFRYDDAGMMVYDLSEQAGTVVVTYDGASPCCVQVTGKRDDRGVDPEAYLENYQDTVGSGLELTGVSASCSKSGRITTALRSFTVTDGESSLRVRMRMQSDGKATLLVIATDDFSLMPQQQNGFDIVFDSARMKW